MLVRSQSLSWSNLLIYFSCTFWTWEIVKINWLIYSNLKADRMKNKQTNKQTPIQSNCNLAALTDDQTGKNIFGENCLSYWAIASVTRCCAQRKSVRIYLILPVLSISPFHRYLHIYFQDDEEAVSSMHPAHQTFLVQH